MAESYLISQLVKVIEDRYKQKAVLEFQIGELREKQKRLDEQIENFCTSIGYIAPDFDFRQIRADFNGKRLARQVVFSKGVLYLVSEVLKKHREWLDLKKITLLAMELDGQDVNKGVSREHQSSVGRVIKSLYQQGLIERKGLDNGRRQFGACSEWRLKPL